MAVYSIEQNNKDEIGNYQIGRYISTNEAVWKILGFQIPNGHPVVEHLQVHLENGQRVFFNKRNSAKRAQQPPKSTLTEFFALS